MFVLASLMGLVAAGMAFDFSGGGHHDSTDPEGEPTEGATDALPPIMPDEAEGPGSLPVSDTQGVIETGVSDTSSSPAEHSGHPDDDPDLHAIIGTGGRDVLMGGMGADRVDGGQGDDDLRGGLGDDDVRGGDGNDWIQGEGSYGAGGGDILDGGRGDDSVAGQGGNDLIWGGEGDDTLLGGEGDDTLFGGAGADWLSGNAGNDVLVSGGGADDLDGGAGNDLLIGNDDPETVFLRGGEGDDVLMPGAGDYAEGLAGADSFELRLGDGDLPVIGDFDATEDHITLHLPADLAGHAQIGVISDADGTTLITVNGHAIARLIGQNGLTTDQIGITCLPAQAQGTFPLPRDGL